MVLKFGACIVDALQSYTQPIVVYLPPFGELRGGAWAVLDTKINPTCITMIADPESRGGVIEPTGVVEIKFRQRDLYFNFKNIIFFNILIIFRFALMLKTDKKLQMLEEIANDKNTDKVDREITQQKISERKELLTPIFRAAVTKFADLHDTTARMLSKGAIHVFFFS